MSDDTPNTSPIGYIVGGGLKEGFRVRLTVPADTVQEGSFVVVDSGRFRYYGLTTDLQLGSTDPRFADEKSDRLPIDIQSTLYGKTLYTTLSMFPTLMLDTGPELGTAERAEWQERVDSGQENPGPRPVKTIPAHHAAARQASKGDVAQIFGEEGGHNFKIGTTIEQGYPVCIDLERLVKRSSGIFGATGTGKSFLTRIVLAGLMRDDVAGALVFDMHNEYGFDDLDSDRGQRVNGLKSIFGSKVQVAALGEGTMVRGQQPSFTLQFNRADFTREDFLLLTRTLNLTDTASAVMGALQRDLGKNWFSRFMAMVPGATVEDDETGKRIPAPDSVEHWANGANIHQASAVSLHRKLQEIHNKPYIVEHATLNPVRQIVDQLDSGNHVILSFGHFDSELDYLLVSNILTRRIREQWVEKTERHKSFSEAAPKPLVIVVEEAHKLLSPELSKQTAFGTIAREMRKYNVTLLIIDQRPSGIDDEVMSQLGTRITGWLGDEDDIRAVLSGLSGREQLRGMLARLQEKEEVLLLGWGVKMPIPVRSRRYDDTFYREMKDRPAKEAPGGGRRPPPQVSAEDAVKDLF